MTMPLHQTYFQVRDYECDIQGIVNNGVYMNYLEHARHEFLKANNIDFAQLAKQKINLVVVRAELDYKQSLKSSDKFSVQTYVENGTQLKFTFNQAIYRQEVLMLKAKITGVALNDKHKPFVFTPLQETF